MLPMPINISAGTPKPAIHLPWEDFRYLIRAVERKPPTPYYWKLRAALLESTAFADDGVIIPLPD